MATPPANAGATKARPMVATRAAPFARVRIVVRALAKAVRAHLWFPHWPLALLLAAGGAWLLHADFGAGWRTQLETVLTDATLLRPGILIPLLIGGGMLTMAAGLLFRSRVAWLFALLLALAAVIDTGLGGAARGHVLLGYFVLVAILLVAAWRRFDRSSVTASTLFALTSVAMLVLYATFGTFYLGGEFHPQVHDLVTALYFAIVTMTTVGYGDITPQTPGAKLFAVSVILLGVAVFATSLTAVIGPMLDRSLAQFVNRTGRKMKREGHCIVIGNTPLAINTWRELHKRGVGVTRVLRAAPEEPVAGDVVYGDPSSVEVLREAGAPAASAVLAMLDDDSENAFIVLAVRELGGHARTVAAVNDARHLPRVQLVQPDVVIAPQVLGGELIAMLLAGEDVTADFVLSKVFQQAPRGAPGAA